MSRASELFFGRSHGSGRDCGTSCVFRGKWSAGPWSSPPTISEFCVNQAATSQTTNLYASTGKLQYASTGKLKYASTGKLKYVSTGKLEYASTFKIILLYR